jgi:ribosome biogenesis protein UTP30
LIKKIQSDEAAQKSSGEKRANLLEDADDEDAEDETPLWIILTTKKHIVDKKRLKPGKIDLPHPLRAVDEDNLRICLITADPQRRYKDLIAEPSFPLEVSKRIARVIGMEKIKSKYKTYESKRQLLSEYDVFLADDRIITYLPGALGKVFYKGGSKRPIPVSLEGKRQSVDENGNKRRKLAEGGEKVKKADVKAEDVAREIKRAVGCSLVHLAPSTTTAVKVGTASMTPEQLRDNVEVVVSTLVEQYVPQQWKNVRTVHVKGPETAALPIWMTSELWADEADVLEEAPSKENPGKKRKRSALTNGEGTEVIEVPGPDGKMRRIEKPSKKGKKDRTDADAVVAKAAESEKSHEDEVAKASEKAEKAARKEALKKQKELAKVQVTDGVEVKKETKEKKKASKKVKA